MPSIVPGGESLGRHPLMPVVSVKKRKKKTQLGSTTNSNSEMAVQSDEMKTSFNSDNHGKEPGNISHLIIVGYSLVETFISSLNVRVFSFWKESPFDI